MRIVVATIVVATKIKSILIRSNEVPGSNLYEITQTSYQYSTDEECVLHQPVCPIEMHLFVMCVDNLKGYFYFTAICKWKQIDCKFLPNVLCLYLSKSPYFQAKLIV